MSPNAQLIAIAEATGYRWYWDRWSPDGQGNWQLNLAYPPEEGIANPCWTGMAGETRAATPEEIAEAKSTGTFIWRGQPFLHDLNAMHEAEKTLTTEQLRQYELGLIIACAPETWFVMAPVKVRAEAFLRAKGLWVES